MLEDLAQAKIHGIQPIAIERTRLNDVQELESVSAAEGPSERRLGVERKHLAAKTLALHRWEVVAGKRQAAECPADLHTDLR